MNNWLKALKIWNDKKGGKYTVPSKGTTCYLEVRKIQNTFDQKGVITRQKGGNPMVVGAVADAVTAAAPALSSAVNDVTNLVGDINKRGYEARDKAGKYTYINEKRKRKDRAKDMAQFAKFKKKYPYMSDAQLWNYVTA